MQVPFLWILGVRRCRWCFCFRFFQRLRAPTHHVASLPAALDREVERVAEAMAANPIYRITNRETAMAYFRANALTRLMATKGNAP